MAFEEGKDLEKVIDITLYMTAAKAKTDIRGAGLQMALSIIHRRDKKDLITGLSTRTQAGRPNWNEVHVYHNYFFIIFTFFQCFFFVITLDTVDFVMYSPMN